jgi:hypothetical protein
MTFSEIYLLPDTFVCTYSGEILRDSVAEVEGKKKEGDIYFADLNLIDLVENEKISQGIDFIDHDYGFFFLL